MSEDIEVVVAPELYGPVIRFDFNRMSPGFLTAAGTIEGLCYTVRTVLEERRAKDLSKPVGTMRFNPGKLISDGEGNIRNG